MALNTFDIGLPQNYILVYDFTDANIWSIFIDPDKYAYALVDQVYNGCLTTVYGNCISYKKEGRIALVHESGSFFIIRESDIVFYENNNPAL